MTSWRDEHSGGRFPGQPMSRREAREAERRAAETMLEKPPHPSGVVDFEAGEFRGEFSADQDFNVGDTQDIWQALTRGGQARQAPEGLDRFRSGVPEAPAAARSADTGAMSGELLDRVRESVLRRRPEEIAAPEPSRRDRRHVEPVEPAAPPAAFGAQPWAVEPQPARQAGFEGYDYEDDGYYDEPYAPEPTIAIGVRANPDRSQPVFDDPGAFQHGLAEPHGNDALTFSSPIPQVAPQQHAYLEDADPEFLEPEEQWEDDGDEGYAPAPAPIALDARPYRPEQIGPPSEVTDLAGFEEMIRLARQQPQPQLTPAPQRPAVAWADEAEVQEGFTGLLSRQAQASHGSSSALILPVDPQQVDVTQAVNGTGDIFVTGTMQLSRSLSTTGAAHDMESPELDRLYDAVQDESAGVAPVRAARAVSTGPHRAVVGRTSRRGNVIPTVLAIVAGAMAVGVVTLLVGSWVLRLF